MRRIRWKRFSSVLNVSGSGTVRRPFFCTVVLALLASSIAGAPGGTTGAIKIVVPAPAGGAGDIVARILAEHVGRARGATMVVENRGGAGTIIGTEAVSHAAPNGNTLLLTLPALLINPHIRNVNYHPLTSFEPICKLVSSPGIIVVKGDAPYHTLDDLLAAARLRGAELSVASAGPGTAHHIGLAMLKRAANIDFTYVPYPGGGPAINALLGGHVTAVLAEYAPLAEHLKVGKLRALATTARTRTAVLPDVPAVAESFKDYEVDFWWGLFAPAKTPSETVSQYAEWFAEAIQSADLNAKVIELGLFPAVLCGSEFGALLRRQFDAYGRIIRETKIKAD